MPCINPCISGRGRTWSSMNASSPSSNTRALVRRTCADGRNNQRIELTQTPRLRFALSQHGGALFFLSSWPTRPHHLHCPKRQTFPSTAFILAGDKMLSETVRSFDSPVFLNKGHQARVPGFPAL